MAKSFSAVVFLAVLFISLPFLPVGVRADDDNDNDRDGRNRRVLYDNIVVGTGAGGIAVIEELSRNPWTDVLALEQGVECKHCTNLGAFTQDAWAFQDRIEPNQQQFTALIREPSDLKLKALGGKMKAMGNVATRPSDIFLDTTPGWPQSLNSTNLLPYFKGYEKHYCCFLPQNVTGISPADCAKYHGCNGPIQIASQVFPVLDPITQGLANYAKANGFFDSDYNDGTHQGLAFEQNFKIKSNMSDIFSAATRGDPQVQLLPPSVIAARRNLKLQLGAKVVRILINNRGRAEGVEYQINGTGSYKAYARNRVWICAGALFTPQLLQLSGIGPASLLAELGIPLIADNPAVGATLKSHQAVIMGFRSKQPINHNSTWGSYNVVDWWASSGMSRYKDLQIEMLEGFYVDSVEPEGAFPLEVLNRFLQGQVSQPFLGMEIESLDTAANGYVRAGSASIDEHPVWDLGWDYGNFLGTQDLLKLFTAINLVRDVMTGNNSFAKTYIAEEVYPRPYWLAYLAQMGVTNDTTSIAKWGMPLLQAADYLFIQYDLTHFYHITTTVPLGVATNLLGEIKGVPRLSVCDNGVLPANPDGNPTFTTLAVCRKLAREQQAIDEAY